VELFDAHGVAFVSVTQSFNTTTTLNVLLSFAQFEREVTGERIRDKIAASKKKGLWVGGVVPLGYEVNDRKLIVNDEEAATVRLIFRRYLDLGPLSALRRDLREQGIVTRKANAFLGAGNWRPGFHQWAIGPYVTQPNVPRRDQSSR
jgi:site-specific DNA recombinase